MAVKLLLTEADASLGSFYKERLQAEGFDVRWVRDGEAALETAQEYHPDLLLLDLLMPKVSGGDVLDILRHTPGLEQTPTILLTAVPQPSSMGGSNSGYVAQSRTVVADLIDRIRYRLNLSLA